MVPGDIDLVHDAMARIASDGGFMTRDGLFILLMVTFLLWVIIIFIIGKII